MKKNEFKMDVNKRNIVKKKRKYEKDRSTKFLELMRNDKEYDNLTSIFSRNRYEENEQIFPTPTLQNLKRILDILNKTVSVFNIIL